MKRFTISFYFQHDNLQDIITCYPQQTQWLDTTLESAIAHANEVFAIKKSEVNFYGLELTQVLKTKRKQILSLHK